MTKDLHEEPFDDTTIAKLEIFEDYAKAWIPTFVMYGEPVICIFDFLDKVFQVIDQTPQHKYQILTKREKILQIYCSQHTIPDNVWLGVSVESAKTKNRIDYLREIPAKIRFLSVEPLISDVGKLDLRGIHWVIVGGESGPKARPMQPEWAINVQRQCIQQGVAFFFKQWGAWGEDGIKRTKKANGRIFLGQEWNEEPRGAMVS